jgi:protease-4
MDLAKLESLAGGRVWTGAQAKERGLVDELGTLDDAIAAAKTMAKLGAKEAEVESFPKPANPFEALFGLTDDNAPTDARLLRALFPEAAKRLKAFSWLPALVKDHTIMLLPFDVQIN